MHLMKESQTILRTLLCLIISSLLGVLAKGLLDGWLPLYIRNFNTVDDLNPLLVMTALGFILNCGFYLIYLLIFRVLVSKKRSLILESAVMGVVAILFFAILSGLIAGFRAVRVTVEKDSLAFIPILIMGSFLPLFLRLIIRKRNTALN